MEIKQKINTLETNKTVIKSVEDIIENAINLHASDIHFEYDEKDLIIKCRIDGILKEIESLKKMINKAPLEIISRIKIISKLNVAEKRKPQDGSFTYESNKRKYDIRVATLPSVSGETIVLRLFNKELDLLEVLDLGFSEKNVELIHKMIERKHGLILISGPTGSGKSTTLYSLIKQINNKERKIISIEDPVEKRINGIVQIETNDNIDLTFSNLLKNILRNDPDIIVISEIRDIETAKIAIQAALTGHLVLASIHTNDAISTIVRLEDIGIPKYLILDSLIGVVAQRLVRKTCVHCNGTGCDKCNSGYYGRTTIGEVLYLNQEIRNHLRKDITTDRMLKNIKNEGFESFEVDIDNKVNKNIISKKDVVGSF